MPRRSGQPRKAKPTTVRLIERLDSWVRRRALEHPDGQSGVINDAVEFYKAHVEKKSGKLFDTIVNGSANGESREDATDAH